MPTYQYLCESCGLDFEHYQSFTDDSIPKCPNRKGGGCKSRGKGKVKKVLTAPSITFKGSGFYKNDSRSGSSDSSSSSSDSSSSDSSSSDSSSSSSTDATKSDSKKSDTKKSDSKKSDAKKSTSSAKKEKASK